MRRDRAASRILKRLAIPLAIISLVFNLYFYRQVNRFKKINGKFRVEKVLDGDSLVISLDQTVRLAHLDAPGLKFCYGKEAKQNLEELVLGQYLTINSVGRDQFGRILGRVYLNGQFINELVASNGWAKYDTSNPADEERVRIRKGARQAKEKGLGVWSPRCYQKENPDHPRCLIKGNIGKSIGKKTYHFPGCAEYDRTIVELDRGEQWFCTENEAQQAGYQKSKHCYGKRYLPLAL